MSTEIQGKAPLDMMQYKKILACNREPHVPLDKLFLAKDSRHVVVAHQGNFYKVIPGSTPLASQLTISLEGLHDADWIVIHQLRK